MIRIAITLLLALLAGYPAAAEEVMAIAAAPGRAAIAVARPDSAAAGAAARTQCGAGCAVLAAVAGGACIALARDQAGGLGWAAREEGGDAAAREAALDACRGGGGRCTITTGRCLATARAPAHYGSARPLRIADPRNTIVIIYSHGSRPSREPDPCDMNRINAPFGVPGVIHALDGATIAGRRVIVDGFCTPTRVAPTDPATGQVMNKLFPRAQEIGVRAAAYVAAGVPPRQIILAGHSHGGWASLMVERERPDVVGGVIAFAPAAFGMAADRPEGTQAVRRERYASLASAARLPALIFGFAGDPFESVDDLRALASVRDVRVVAIAQPGPDGRRCALEPHARVRDPCFTETQGAQIRAFIIARVTGGGS